MHRDGLRFLWIRQLARRTRLRSAVRNYGGHPNTKDAAVIVMTGHGNGRPDLAVSLLTSGAAHYVKKTFTGDDLDRAIQQARN